MKSHKLLLLAGIVSLFGGALALYNPVLTSLTLEQLLGWTCVVSGIFNFVSALKYVGEQRVWSILLALFTLVMGYFLIRMPMESLISITTFIIFLLVGAGFTRLIMAFKQRNSASFIPMFLSGLISLLLAGMLLSEYPGTAEELLGIIFAVELISNGISMLAFAWALHKVTVTEKTAHS